MSRRTAYWTLLVVTLVVGLNYMDRYVLAILIEPIRADLQITDTQIGLLTGAAFALLYSTLAIPIARLAERYNRVVILTCAVLLWSLATGLSGLANGFVFLLLARMLVGCGEAGAMAPSLSMVADLFPIERRATAMSIIGLGSAAGNTVAPWIGGWLQSTVGWRMSFVALGLVGVPLALLLIFTVPHPRRGLSDGAAAVVEPLPFGIAIRRLFQRRTFTLLTAALILMSIAEYSMILWMPSLFHRSFGVELQDLGARLALFQGVPFFLGTYFGGVAADRLYKHDPRWIIWVPMISVMLTAPAVFWMCMAQSENTMLWLLIVPSFANGVYIGPCYALVQNLSAVHSRATATAVLAFTVNLIGAGLGPLLLGALSGHLTAEFGEQSLRYAFYALVPLYVCAALIFIPMAFQLRSDLENARQDTLGLLDEPVTAHARKIGATQTHAST
ncbi:spinster family MFS transporter [Steroidobacter flavus]|uniref:Spinster family MFS transporter n=1 Tax=Steroidobacter flavus TaxID=1842136 RepID=A0ABV8SXL9_9GAMM